MNNDSRRLIMFIATGALAGANVIDTEITPQLIIYDR